MPHCRCFRNPAITTCYLWNLFCKWDILHISTGWPDSFHQQYGKCIKIKDQINWQIRLWRFLRELTALTAYSIVRICFHLSPVFFCCFSTTFSIANKPPLKITAASPNKMNKYKYIINWNPNFQSSKHTIPNLHQIFWGTSFSTTLDPDSPDSHDDSKVHLEFAKLSLNS